MDFVLLIFVMSFPLALIVLIIGFIILIKGADLFVKGASSIANIFGVSSLVIGLTVVAFGTSAPELAVNIISALKGNASFVVGNIVGSNTFNILAILGISSLIRPLIVQTSTTWKEIPFSLLAIVLVFLMGNDRFIDGQPYETLSRIDGFILLSFFIIFLYYIVALAKSGGMPMENNVKTYSRWMSVGFIVLGLGMLAGGAQLIINSATTIARSFGISDLLIGLTILAAGTSLPELATSAVAAYRGQSDIAIGNIVGSNIFNIFWILGLTAVIYPIPLPPGAGVDIAVTVIATLSLFAFMFVGNRHKLDRWQGGTMFVAFIAYLAFLFIRG